MARWFLVLLLAGCASRQPALPAPVPEEWQWVEIRTEHFHLRAQLGQTAALEVARSMEKVRAGLVAFWGPGFAPADRLDVIFFRDHASLSDFVPHAVRGLLVTTATGPWLVTSFTDFRNSSIQTVQSHELAHHLSHYLMVRQPRWYSEGLATYLETMALGEGQVHFGRRPAWISDAHLSARPLSLAALWAWVGLELPPEEAGLHVAQSWALIHHLFNFRRPQLAAFEKLLGGGAEPRAAWAEAFAGLTDSELEAELAEAPPPSKIWAAPLRFDELAPAVSALPLAEVHAIRALLRIHTTEPLEKSVWTRKIQQEVEQALQLDPNNERALLLKSMLIVDPAARIAFVRSVVARLPQSGRALLLLAMNLESEDTDPRPLLEQAHALAPDDIETINELAWYSAVYADAPRALALAERAVAQRPWAAAFVNTHAGALAASGRCVEAAARQRQALELLGRSNRAARYRSYLERYEQGCTPANPARPAR